MNNEAETAAVNEAGLTTEQVQRRRAVVRRAMQLLESGAFHPKKGVVLDPIEATDRATTLEVARWAESDLDLSEVGGPLCGCADGLLALAAAQLFGDAPVKDLTHVYQFVGIRITDEAVFLSTKVKARLEAYNLFSLEELDRIEAAFEELTIHGHVLGHNSSAMRCARNWGRSLRKNAHGRLQAILAHLLTNPGVRFNPPEPDDADAE